MHPFVNIDRGVIFWWSPKCGCTTVKSIMLESMVFDHVSRSLKVEEELVSAAVEICLKGGRPKDSDGVYETIRKYLSSRNVHSLHPQIAGPSLLLDLDSASKFANVLFVRDPFKRFVSGLVDKHIEGFFSNIYAPKNFKEAAFNIGKLESHHFAPQTSEAYLPGLEYDRVFDIENIDYEYLSGLLGMRIAPRLMNREVPLSGFCGDSIADAPYEHLALLKSSGGLPPHECFYDEKSRRLVGEYYKGDLDLMRRWLTPSDA